MPYTPILATLGYVLSKDRRQVLLIHRNSRPDDPHFGKYNGLGGKLERDEDAVAGMKRELREEAGINATSLRLKGTISWPGFGQNGEDWFGFIFVIDDFAGDVQRSNTEGSLQWIPIENVADLPLWEGDRLFLPMVFADDGRTFHGVMPYADGRPTGWTYSQLKS